MKSKLAAKRKLDVVIEDDAGPGSVLQHNVTSRQANNRANQRYNLRNPTAIPPNAPQEDGPANAARTYRETAALARSLPAPTTHRRNQAQSEGNSGSEASHQHASKRIRTDPHSGGDEDEVSQVPNDNPVNEVDATYGSTIEEESATAPEKDQSTILNATDVAATSDRYGCGVCAESHPVSDFPALDGCAHAPHCCKRCLAEWIRTQLDGPNWREPKRPCDCDNPLQDDQIKSHVEPEVFEEYHIRLRNARLAEDEEFQSCMHPGCDYGQLHSTGDAGNILTCKNCERKTCTIHQRPWHEVQTCEEYDDSRRGEQESRDLEQQEKASEEEVKKYSKPCPNCGIRIHKYSGCDHMKSSMCEHQFCYECLADYKHIEDHDNSHHAKTCRHHTQWTTGSDDGQDEDDSGYEGKWDLEIDEGEGAKENQERFDDNDQEVSDDNDQEVSEDIDQERYAGNVVEDSDEDGPWEQVWPAEEPDKDDQENLGESVQESDNHDKKTEENDSVAEPMLRADTPRSGRDYREYG